MRTKYHFIASYEVYKEGDHKEVLESSVLPIIGDLSSVSYWEELAGYLFIEDLPLDFLKEGVTRCIFGVTYTDTSGYIGDTFEHDYALKFDLIHSHLYSEEDIKFFDEEGFL